MLRQRLVAPASDTASRLFALRGKLYKQQKIKPLKECGWCGRETDGPVKHTGIVFCSMDCARSYAKADKCQYHLNRRG